MADVNIARFNNSDVVATLSGGGSTGSGVNACVDGSTSTFTGNSRNGGSCSISVVVTFDRAYSINKITLTSTNGTLNGSYSRASLLVDGIWTGTLIDNLPNFGIKNTVTLNGSWENVTAIRCLGNGLGQSAGSFDGFTSLYEIEAFGPVPVDSGLRVYDGSSVVKLASGEDTSKLKIWNGSEALNMVLVETNDTDASPVRVFDGSSVKSIMKVN